MLGGPALVAIAAIVIFFIGQWAAGIYSTRLGKADASEIVIDEVVGQFIALLPFFLVGRADWLIFALAFTFFRLFDIAKPWPVSLADKRHDSFGVMLDDVLAGLYAALLGTGALYFAL